MLKTEFLCILVFKVIKHSSTIQIYSSWQVICVLLKLSYFSIYGWCSRTSQGWTLFTHTAECLAGPFSLKTWVLQD